MLAAAHQAMESHGVPGRTGFGLLRLLLILPEDVLPSVNRRRAGLEALTRFHEDLHENLLHGETGIQEHDLSRFTH